MTELKAEASSRRSVRYELDTALGHLTPTERAAPGAAAPTRAARRGRPPRG